MTKYLICSDIHGRKDLFDKAINVEENLSAVIVAGDLELDTSLLAELLMRSSNKDCSIYAVAGNCDSYLPAKTKLRELTIVPIGEQNKALLLHGHRYAAREDLMSYVASENGCNIVIFGHIHSFVSEEKYGMLFLNPGALKVGSYMILEETEGKISVLKRTL